MNLSDTRTMLRGWLQDTVSVQWTDEQMNRYINYALRETQKTLLSVDPEALKCIYTADTRAAVTGEDQLYEFPAATWAVFEIATSTDGTNFTPLERISLTTARTNENAAGFIHWSTTHFMLYPPSSTAVTNGVRVIVAPTAVMSSDYCKNPLPAAFETLHLKWATKLALMDVGEPTDKLDAEINALTNGVPRFYLTNTQPAFVVPTGYDEYELT